MSNKTTNLFDLMLKAIDETPEHIHISRVGEFKVGTKAKSRIGLIGTINFIAIVAGVACAWLEVPASFQTHLEGILVPGAVHYAVPVKDLQNL